MSYDDWKTMTPAEDAGGDSVCDMCERATWNDTDIDGRIICDECALELEYENAVDNMRKGNI